MVVAVDCDNVINNLQEVVTNVFNQRYGTNYTLNDFTSYYTEVNLPEQKAINMQAIYGEPGIYDLVKPLPGAKSALQNLIDNGHQVYVVTDAIPDTYGEKVKWIKHYFPFIDDAHIVCMKHKWMFRCDVMVEDKLETLIQKPYYYRILFNYPWNQSNRDFVYDIHRCTDWSEALDVINKLNDEE